MNMRTIISLLLLTLPVLLNAQSKGAIGLEIPAGEPIPAAVNELDKIAAEMGLTEKQVSERVVAKLEKQGIPTAKVNKGFYLSVDIELNEKSFRGYRKWSDSLNVLLFSLADPSSFKTLESLEKHIAILSDAQSEIRSAMRRQVEIFERYGPALQATIRDQPRKLSEFNSYW